MNTAPISLAGLLLACAVALPLAHAQSPGAGAAAAQPAMSGTQGGTQPTLQQGGMSTSNKDASQVNIQLRRPGQPDMPTGAPGASLPSTRTSTVTLAPMPAPMTMPLPAASQKR